MGKGRCRLCNGWLYPALGLMDFVIVKKINNERERGFGPTTYRRSGRFSDFTLTCMLVRSSSAAAVRVGAIKEGASQESNQRIYIY